MCIALAAPPAHALCGDPSGDGFVRAGDSLTALKTAVAGDYDRRADVKPIDGKLSAVDALAILKAAVSDELLECAGADEHRAVVSTAPSDFTSAGIAVVDIASRQANWRSGSVGNDSVIRWQGGKAVVINRQGHDSLQVMDIDQASLPTVKECSVWNGIDEDSNPQDLVLLSPTKGYVTLYGGKQLLVINPEILDPAVDPACHSLIVKRIDLGAFDSDGVPEMDQMVLVDGKLFVSLQLLNPYPTVSAPGKLAVIDTATDTVVGRVDLTIRDPFAATKGLVYDEFQRRIYVGGPGEHATNLSDGGIEVVNPQTMQSEGVLATGADLGGDLFDFVMVGSKRAYGIVANETENSVVEIDLEARTVKAVLMSSVELISDIELTQSGQLWVASREENGETEPGLRVFRISDNSELTVDSELRPAPISTGSSPFTITFAP